MNSNKLKILLAQDITDPSDFPKQTPLLRQLDSAARCPICADYFDGPVSLICGHSFCSMCIRSVISSSSSKAQCPTCRQNTTESQLRPNPAIEDIVAAWKPARPFVLGLAKHEEDRVAAVSPVPPKKKRRLSPPSVAGPSCTASAEFDGDVKPQATVECPVCSRLVAFEEINGHMDNNCEPTDSGKPSSKSQKAQWSYLMGQPKSKGKEKDRADAEDRLPKVSYDILKDKQLKDKLLEHGLPTTGDRAMWTARHQRWTMLWNANLDKSAAKRQTKAGILKELKKWEEERKAQKEKPTVDESYLKTHSSEFRQLIAAARSKAAVTERVDGPSGSSSAPRLPSEDDIIVVDSDLEAE